MKSQFTFAKISLSDFAPSKIIEEFLDYSERKPRHWHLCAGYTFVASANDSRVAHALEGGYNICDSKPVSLFINLFSKESFRNLRGADFFKQIASADQFGKHYLLGGTHELHSQVKGIISESNPAFEIVGCWSGNVSSMNYSTQIPFSEIRNSGAGVVWICLGSPKQDLIAKEIHEILQLDGVAIGAGLEFFAGTKNQAPMVIQTLGLEWFFRFVLEPRRLWKRYLLGNLQLIHLMVLHVFVQRRRK